MDTNSSKTPAITNRSHNFNTFPPENNSDDKSKIIDLESNIGSNNIAKNDGNKSRSSDEQPLKKYNSIPKVIEDRKNNDKHEIGRLWSMEKFGHKHYYEYIVSLSISAFWILVSIIPIYNKIFFQKQYYPYPIATAGIQLFIVSTILIMVNTVQYYFSSKDSWIFDSNFLWKLKWVAPIGILFGLKYGITNSGLSVVPASTHVLLQSTDLVWTLLGAWYINGERVRPIGIVCLLGCIAGTVCLSLHIHESIAAPIYAICVNLTSPILLGLCITTLRSACMELMRGENAISSTELTALKLLLSSSIAFVMSMIFENQHGDTLSWYDAFLQLPQSTQLGVIGGAIPILLFQVNCTFLTFLTTSVSVGLVGQIKILPQWTLALLFAPSTQHVHFSALNIMGAILTVLSAAAYAWSNYVSVYSSDDGIVADKVPDIVNCNEEQIRLMDCCSTSTNSTDSSVNNEQKTYSSCEDKDESSCQV